MGGIEEGRHQLPDTTPRVNGFSIQHFNATYLSGGDLYLFEGNQLRKPSDLAFALGGGYYGYTNATLRVTSLGAWRSTEPILVQGFNQRDPLILPGYSFRDYQVVFTGWMTQEDRYTFPGTLAREIWSKDYAAAARLEGTATNNPYYTPSWLRSHFTHREEWLHHQSFRCRVSIHQQWPHRRIHCTPNSAPAATLRANRISINVP